MTQATPPRSWLWQPNVIVFVSSACIMIIELVASRIIAPIVGSSLYTWTSVIGIVLAGITLGNYLGGRLADRFASLKFLGIVYLAAALSCVIILATEPINRLIPGDWHIITKLVVLITALFFVPCTLLGMMSPIVAKLAVSDLAKTGSTVGKIYAAGTVGSIVGTFATGYFLISWFGSFTIVLSVMLVLAAMGALFLFGARWQAAVVALVLVGGGWALFQSQNWVYKPCVVETNYYCIKMYEEEKGGKPVRVLVLDHLVHSYVSLEDPKHLEYPYEKVYAEVADYRAATDAQLSILMIGGGGYTFARYVEAVYPNSEMHVAEIDPGVTDFAHDYLALPRTSKVTTFNEDARMFFARQPNRRYDLVLGDAFNHFSVPYHLTTKEFNDRVRAWLTDDGMYVMNIIDGPYGEFVRSEYNTLKKTFPYVYLGEGNGDWRHATRSFFILIGSNKELDTQRFAQFDGGDGDALLSRMFVDHAEITRLLTEAPVITLTDDYVPVDQMLASVFREEVPK